MATEGCKGSEELKGESLAGADQIPMYPLWTHMFCHSQRALSYENSISTRAIKYAVRPTKTQFYYCDIHAQRLNMLLKSYPRRLGGNY